VRAHVRIASIEDASNALLRYEKPKAREEQPEKSFQVSFKAQGTKTCYDAWKRFFCKRGVSGFGGLYFNDKDCSVGYLDIQGILCEIGQPEWPKFQA
jgi:hypothetical protein